MAATPGYRTEGLAHLLHAHLHHFLLSHVFHLAHLQQGDGASVTMGGKAESHPRTTQNTHTASRPPVRLTIYLRQAS